MSKSEPVRHASCSPPPLNPGKISSTLHVALGKQNSGLLHIHMEIRGPSGRLGVLGGTVWHKS